MVSISKKVTVIVPCFNYGIYLKDTIDSVLRQNIKDIQIIIIDDGSTDNTRDIANTYGDKVEYVYQDNRGLSAARNTGLGIARGEYIQFLDSDDILGPDALAGRISILDADPNVGIAVCRNHYFTATINGRPKIKYTSGWPLYKNNLTRHLFFLNIAPPHAYLVRRSVVNEVGLFDEKMKVCEDYDYWARAIIKGFKIKYSKDGIVYYRKHPKSMSNNTQRQHKYDTLVHKKLLNNLSTNSDTNVDHKFGCLLALLAGTLSLLLRTNNSEKQLNLELYEHYASIIELVEKLLKSHSIKWNAFSYLYYLRVAYEARLNLKIGKISMSQYVQMMNAILPVNARLHGFRKWKMTFKHATGTEDIGWLTRYRIIKYSF